MLQRLADRSVRSRLNYLLHSVLPDDLTVVGPVNLDLNPTYRIPER